MKHKKYLMLIVGAIIVFNFNSAYSETSQQKYENFKSRYESNDFKSINQKIPFSSVDATLSQLSDMSKASKKEKDILDLWLKVQREYVSDAMTEANRSQPYLLNILQDKINSEENIYINLYQGKITFGEANKQRKALTLNTNEKIKIATSQYQQTQTQENQRRQRQQQVDSQRQEQCKYLKSNLEAMLAEKNNIFKKMSDGLAGSSGPVESRAANQAMVDENNRRSDQTILQYQSMIAATCGG